MSSHSKTVVSPGFLLPLPPARPHRPINISLVRWLKLPIDQRAPERSVALVDVQPEYFIAVIVDVVAQRLLWRITARSAGLELLYKGVQGGDPDHGRGTLVVTARPRSLPQGIDKQDHCAEHEMVRGGGTPTGWLDHDMKAYGELVLFSVPSGPVDPGSPGATAEQEALTRATLHSAVSGAPIVEVVTCDAASYAVVVPADALSPPAVH